MPKVRIPTRLKGSKYFWILVFTTFIGLGLSIYWTLSNEYVPINKNTLFHSGKDLDVIVTAENYTNVPLASFLFPKTAVVSVDVYFKTLPTYLKAVKLSSNGSSILTTKTTNFETLNKSRYPNLNPMAANYTVTLNMGHPLVIGNYTDQYTVNLFYRKNNDTGNVYVEKVPFVWRIQTLDWSLLSYFWIIFSGVLLSRMFIFKGNSNIKFNALELVWVPFSAIITLLIFSSFMDQLYNKLTINILTNLALAFAFGFGFDKVLEVWQKSPGLERPNDNEDEA
ncbi:MAG TPA: hypothetical protein VLD84_06230 [Nitrososphaeraceae archaeon]|nr:hypothetical protein [Nitrososphaeraceae archaeon]